MATLANKGLIASALFAAWMAAPAQAQQCMDIDSTLTGMITDRDNFTSESTIADGPLAGTLSFAGDVQSITQISGVTIVAPVEMSFALTASLDYATENGTLNTAGVGTIEGAAGGFSGFSTRVTGGDGAFEGASGFFFTGFVFGEEGSGALTGRVIGTVCTP